MNVDLKLPKRRISEDYDHRKLIYHIATIKAFLAVSLCECFSADFCNFF